MKVDPPGDRLFGDPTGPTWTPDWYMLDQSGAGGQWWTPVLDLDVLVLSGVPPFPRKRR